MNDMPALDVHQAKSDDGAVAAEDTWTELTPTVSQAFSDVDNPFMFQGRPPCLDPVHDRVLHSHEVRQTLRVGNLCTAPSLLKTWAYAARSEKRNS